MMNLEKNIQLKKRKEKKTQTYIQIKSIIKDNYVQKVKKTNVLFFSNPEYDKDDTVL